MPTNTPEIGLVKPELNENVNLVQHFNNNWDKIDNAFKDKAYQLSKAQGFMCDPLQWYGYTKLAALFQQDEVWSYSTRDTTNFRIGNCSIKIAEDDNTASTLSCSRNNISLDLSTFNNGEASTEDDYIFVVLYISDVSKVASIRVYFAQEATFNGTANYKYFYVDAANLGTGWNFLKVRKGDFITNGAGAWSGIQSMNVRWYSTANALGAYVSYQLVQLVKKHPTEAKFNQFQSNENGQYVVDFTPYGANYENWYVGLENGRIVCKEIGLQSGAASLLGTKKFKDFIITREQLASYATGAGYTSWFIDASNYISARISGDILYLEEFVNGVKVVNKNTPLVSKSGDLHLFRLAKKGTSVVLEVIKNRNYSSPYILSYINCGLDGQEGCLSIGSNSSGGAYLVSASITNTHSAAYAGEAAIARDVRARQKGSTINEELTRMEGYFFDPARYIRGGSLNMATFKSTETWTPINNTVGPDTTNVKLGFQSVKLTQSFSTAGWCEAELVVSADMTKFTDGSSISDDDYIVLCCYISDVSKINMTYGIYVCFITSAGSNQFLYYFNSAHTEALVTGWNYLRVKRSAMAIGGTANWANITKIAVGWLTLANALNSYVSFQYVAVQKKDPFADMPNPFQRMENGVYLRDMLPLSTDLYFVGADLGKMVVKSLPESFYLEGQQYYKDCIAELTFRAGHSTRATALWWIIPGSAQTNGLRMAVYDDVLELKEYVNGTPTTIASKSINITAGDIITYRLIKKGATVECSILINGENQGLNYIKGTTVYKDTYATVGLGGSSSSAGSQGVVESLSVTTIANAHKAGFADIARRLEAQPRYGITRSSGQSVNTGTWTHINLTGSPDYDNTGMYYLDPVDSVGCARVTVSGWYDINCYVEFAAGLTGVRMLDVTRNGSGLDGTRVDQVPATGGQNTDLKTSFIKYLSAGDLIKIRVFHSQGSAIDVAPAQLILHRRGDT